MNSKRKILALILVFFLVAPTILGISSKNAYAAGSTTTMANMHEIDSHEVYVVDDGITDSYGNTYSSNVLRFQAGEESFITYDLNGQYESFTCDIVCSTQTASEAEMNVGIFADEELVYELKGYTRQKPAEHVEIDVSGVGTLSIKTAKTAGYESWIYAVNGVFTKAENASVYPERNRLENLFVIDEHYTWRSNSLFTDAFGNLHNGFTKLQCGEDAFILYNLDKKYVSLSGTIVAGGDTGDASMNIQFYLDDKLVHSEDAIKRSTTAKTFEIDVTGVSVLKIATSKNEGYESFLYVTDGILKVHEHEVGDWEITREPTCEEAGEKVQICKTCGETVSSEVIPSLGHTPDGKSVVVKEATCIEPGEEAQHCTVCGEQVEVRTIDALGHTSDGKWIVTKEATCAEEGEEVQYCSVCGEVAESRSIEKTAHTPGKDWETVREATCAEEGLRQKVCTVCGEAAEEEILEKIDHNFGSWTTLSGSVWNNPIVKERTCSVCGEVEHVESNSTSWLKPLVIVLFLIIFGGLAVILVTLKMNGLPLEPASVKKLFSKETLSDTDIENLLNKKDDTEHKE